MSFGDEYGRTAEELANMTLDMGSGGNLDRIGRAILSDVTPWSGWTQERCELLRDRLAIAYERLAGYERLADALGDDDCDGATNCHEHECGDGGCACRGGRDDGSRLAKVASVTSEAIEAVRGMIGDADMDDAQMVATYAAIAGQCSGICEVNRILGLGGRE